MSMKAMATGLTSEDLKTLKTPFARDVLGVKVQSVSKDRARALLVLYLQHTDVQNRLEEVDPAWSCEAIAEERVGETYYVRMRLTLKGIPRENVGEGGDPKAAYSDALKRCAMLFGVGRYLYDSPLVWVPYDESRDRFRQWSMDDYERAAAGAKQAPATQAPAAGAGARPGLKTSARAQQAQGQAQTQPQAKPQAPAKQEKASATGRTRDQLNRVLMNLYRPYLSRFPETRFVELLHGRYNVGETRLMTLEQMEDLVSFMEDRIKSVA